MISYWHICIPYWSHSFYRNKIIILHYLNMFFSDLFRFLTDSIILKKIKNYIALFRYVLFQLFLIPDWSHSLYRNKKIICTILIWIISALFWFLTDPIHFIQIKISIALFQYVLIISALFRNIKRVRQ